MIRLTAILAPLALMAPGPALAAEDRPATAISEQDLSALRLAIDRGQQLYLYDQAAWHATDAMLEDVDEPATTGIRGWVVTPAGDGMLVTYWKPNGDSFSGVYSAVWSRERVGERKVLQGEATRLSEEQLALVAARNAVDDSGLESCVNAPFNTVVMPEPEGDAILVYMMTPQTSASSIPLGGHYRFTVTDGSVVDQRSFTNSCLEVGLADPEGRGELEALGVSHLLDPVPTEIHVFSMLAAGKPVFIMTPSNSRVWVAEASGGQVRVRTVE